MKSAKRSGSDPQLAEHDKLAKMRWHVASRHSPSFRCHIETQWTLIGHITFVSEALRIALLAEQRRLQNGGIAGEQ
jgi:hypothetical protein